jgi:predicted phosphodiesterase
MNVKKKPFNPSLPLIRAEAISWAQKHRKGFTLKGMAKAMEISEGEAKMLVEHLSHHDGYNLMPQGNKWTLSAEVAVKEKLSLDRLVGDEYQFGLVTDTHLVNKHARLDAAEAAYDEFKRLGIKDVYHAGNIIDGEHRFNKYEISVWGSHNQCQYVADNYPQRSGIRTMFITGDCHEGWYQGREGIDIGWYIQNVCEKSGRKDMIHLGHLERDIEISQPFGKTRMRIMHPGGGSAYALSYASQKMVESFQGGDKPHILILGHYHKFDVNYAREVVTIQAGCLQDQTSFMRKKKLSAHVGFCVCRINSRVDGTIGRCNVDWYPMYDRKYHQKLENYVVK